MDSISFPHVELHDADTEELHMDVNIGRAFPLREDLNWQYKISTRIAEFMHRELSFHSDAVNAMAGIFAEYGAQERPVKFLCGLPLLQSLPDEDHISSMTNRLASALLWSSELEITRHSSFPSWTWAGWKLAHRGDHEHDAFDGAAGSSDSRSYTPIYIKVGFTDGTQLQWELFHERIIELERTGIQVTNLRIAGWTFSCHIQGSNPSFYTDPPAVADKEVFHSFSSKFKILPDQPHPHEVLCLMLTHSDEGFYGSLVLKQSGDGSTFERVCSGGNWLNDAKFKVFKRKKLAMYGELELQWREVVIV